LNLSNIFFGQLENKKSAELLLGEIYPLHHPLSPTQNFLNKNKTQHKASFYKIFRKKKILNILLRIYKTHPIQ